eukprot:8987249-Alexandrium_andersonii.AAC.1
MGLAVADMGEAPPAGDAMFEASLPQLLSAGSCSAGVALGSLGVQRMNSPAGHRRRPNSRACASCAVRYPGLAPGSTFRLRAGSGAAAGCSPSSPGAWLKKL